MLQSIGLSEIALPLLLIVLIFLLIPSMIIILMRVLFYQRLKTIERQTESLISEQETKESFDSFIADAEDAYQNSRAENSDQVNPIGIIEGLLNEEKIPLFGVRFNWTEYITQNFPNVILYLGIFGTLIGMGVHLYQTLNNSENGVISDGGLGLGLGFFVGLAGFILGVIIILLNFIFNVTRVKRGIYEKLVIHLESLSSYSLMEE